MAKAKSILDDVLAEIQATAPKPSRWFERVAPEHAETVAELRQAWRDGKLGTSQRRAARSISKLLNARGISTVGVTGVELWLVAR